MIQSIQKVLEAFERQVPGWFAQLLLAALDERVLAVADTDREEAVRVIRIRHQVEAWLDGQELRRTYDQTFDPEAELMGLDSHLGGPAEEVWGRRWLDQRRRERRLRVL